MNTRERLVPALFLAMSLGACDTGILDVLPVDEISNDIAIVDGIRPGRPLRGLQRPSGRELLRRRPTRFGAS